MEISLIMVMENAQDVVFSISVSTLINEEEWHWNTVGIE